MGKNISKFESELLSLYQSYDLNENFINLMKFIFSNQSKLYSTLQTDNMLKTDFKITLQA